MRGKSKKGANRLSSQAYSITDETFVGPWRAPKSTAKYSCGCGQNPNGFDDWCGEHRPRGWAGPKRAGYRWWIPEDVAAHKQKKLKDLLELRGKSMAVIYKLEAEMRGIQKSMAGKGGLFS